MPQLDSNFYNQFLYCSAVFSSDSSRKSIRKAFFIAFYRFDVEENFHPHKITADFCIHAKLSAFSLCVTCTAMHAFKHKMPNFFSPNFYCKAFYC